MQGLPWGAKVMTILRFGPEHQTRQLYWGPRDRGAATTPAELEQQLCMQPPKLLRAGRLTGLQHGRHLPQSRLSYTCGVGSLCSIYGLQAQ